MSISVFRVAEDGLSRERWNFSLSCGFSDNLSMTLGSYAIERRKASKARFSAALPADRWYSDDERSYNSGLQRPTSVPADVLAEAWAMVCPRYYIGWSTQQHEITAQGAGAA